MARHAREGDEVYVGVVTGKAKKPHPVVPDSVFDTVRAEAEAAHRILGVAGATFAGLPPVLLSDLPRHEVNQTIRDLIEERGPDILYVPFPYDLHGDHRATFHAASVAWRANSVMGRAIGEVRAYEVQSETHWNAHSIEPSFSPTLWISLSPDDLSLKSSALACFESQMQPAPSARSIWAVENLARWRGSQQGMESAESFVSVRSLIQ